MVAICAIARVVCISIIECVYCTALFVYRQCTSSIMYVVVKSCSQQSIHLSRLVP